MAGYWRVPFCVFMDRDGVDVHKLPKKTEKAWLIQDLLFSLSTLF